MQRVFVYLLVCVCVCVCVWVSAPELKSGSYELRTEDNKWVFFSISHKWLITGDRGKTCLIFSRYTHTHGHTQAWDSGARWEWWIVSARVINICQSEYWTCQSVLPLGSSTTTTATTSCSLRPRCLTFIASLPVYTERSQQKIDNLIHAWKKENGKEGKIKEIFFFRKEDRIINSVFNFCLYLCVFSLVSCLIYINTLL